MLAVTRGNTLSLAVCDIFICCLFKYTYLWRNNCLVNVKTDAIKSVYCILTLRSSLFFWSKKSKAIQMSVFSFSCLEMLFLSVFVLAAPSHCLQDLLVHIHPVTSLRPWELLTTSKSRPYKWVPSSSLISKKCLSRAGTLNPCANLQKQMRGCCCCCYPDVYSIMRFSQNKT